VGIKRILKAGCGLFAAVNPPKRTSDHADYVQRFAVSGQQKGEPGWQPEAWLPSGSPGETVKFQQDFRS